ncbi:substrate binding domain-containing protein [Xylophilus rhododendri]|uniref:substrate binding domain-containing protein n=1 Tax=Xylophilus rhododendri TaxID=2697032 RepID=UPI002DDA5639|nr:substrate binding domain-containing protein [Xylophilus rhododendri]
MRCKELLASVEEAEAEISARSGEASGRLRLTAPVSFGVQHLAPVWARFRDRHPRVTLDLTLSDRVMDIVDEGFDLGIRIARLPSSSLISRRLTETRMVLCAAPAYLARAGTPRHPGELADHAVLAYSYWAGGDEWSFDGPQGPVSVTTRPGIRTNNGDTCRAVALQGQGVILQPTFLVGADLASGALVELMPQYRAGALGIYAVYASRKHLAPRLRLLIDLLAEWFGEPRWPDGAATPAAARPAPGVPARPARRCRKA